MTGREALILAKVAVYQQAWEEARAFRGDASTPAAFRRTNLEHQRLGSAEGRAKAELLRAARGEDA